MTNSSTPAGGALASGFPTGATVLLYGHIAGTVVHAVDSTNPYAYGTRVLVAFADAAKYWQSAADLTLIDSSFT